jgi:hypothetical protein
MSGDRPTTELGALIAAHPWSRAEFVTHYNQVAGELGESTSLSLRQLDRWIRGELSGLPQSAASSAAPYLRVAGRTPVQPHREPQQSKRSW